MRHDKRGVASQQPYNAWKTTHVQELNYKGQLLVALPELQSSARWHIHSKRVSQTFSSLHVQGHCSVPMLMAQIPLFENRRDRFLLAPRVPKERYGTAFCSRK